MAEAEWKVDVKIKPGSDVHKKLTHLPEIVAQLAQVATGIATKAQAGHKEGQYGIIVQNKSNTRRARALVHPTNNAGIHLELTQHLMLKAAASYGSHKEITTKATGPAIAMGNKVGDSAGTVTSGGAITPVSPESKSGLGA